MYGKKHTATARQKMSVGVRKAYANGLVPWNKGRVYSEDERKKISIATRKAMKKPEIMVKIAARPNAYKKGHVPANAGKKWSEPIRQKMSVSQKKRVARLGYTPPMKGKRHSEESKRKASISHLQSYKNGLVPWHKGKTGIYTEEQIQNLKEKRLHQVIPSKDTKIEKTLQNGLQKNGIGFEKHIPILGQPDIFVEPNICIFADGDYWHGWLYLQGEDFSKQKKFNNNYFENKIRRDVMVTEQLREEGYTVLRFWEHEIIKDAEKCLQKIIKIIKKSRR